MGSPETVLASGPEGFKRALFSDSALFSPKISYARITLDAFDKNAFESSAFLRELLSNMYFWISVSRLWMKLDETAQMKYFILYYFVSFLRRFIHYSFCKVDSLLDSGFLCIYGKSENAKMRRVCMLLKNIWNVQNIVSV